MCSRSGPTPTSASGTPTISSMRRRNARASTGRSVRCRAPVVGQRHPGRSSYTGSTRAIAAVCGTVWRVRPSSRYATASRTVSKVSNTSTFITARCVNPATSAAKRAATPSNQPQRRGRRVVAPNSWPMLRSRSPVASPSSVGIGPEPTAVV